MAADIDEFIRNQKIRMARQKKESAMALQTPNRPQDRLGAILREDEPHPDDVAAQGPTNEERKAAIDGRFGGAAMPGLGEHDADRSRLLASDRQRDYAAFRAAEEARQRQGFGNRRGPPPGTHLMAPAPGMVPPQMPPPAIVAQQQHAKLPGQRQPLAPPHYPPPQRGTRPDYGGKAQRAGKGPEFNRKLEDLERTVAELQEQVARQNGKQPPPEAPRPGWATPDYADLLAAKRKQEVQRRRLEDPEVFVRHDVRSEKERQLEELEFELAAQKAQLMTRRHTPRRAPASDLLDDDDAAWLRSNPASDLVQNRAKLDGRQRPQGGGGKTFRDAQAAQPTGLPVGSEERVSAKARRQGNYRAQLQQQMMEQQEAKRREKAERLGAAVEGAPVSHRSSTSKISAPNAPLLLSGLENLSSLPAYNTPADDAYFYYASHDPLDASGGDVGPHSDSKTPPRQQQQPQQQQQFRTPPTAANRQSGPSGAPGLQAPEDKAAERRRKAQYAQELQRQMAEVAAEKERRRKEQEEYDRKKDEEIAAYHVFQSRGGGGGEPIKLDGQVVTDLRAHRRQGGATPRTTAAPPTVRSSGEFKLHLGEGGPRASEPPTSQRTPRQQVNAHGEVTHARGGHGVFGQPRTEEEKEKIDHYKEDLRRQIEENQRKKEEQKRREKIEEEKEQKRAEEQVQRIKAEYDEELRKKQEKIEATKRKNEELWKEAEEKRKREAEQRKAKVAAPRVSSPKEAPKPPPSPPVPTVSRQQKTSSAGGTAARPPSGPARRESHPDVLRQLERMKKELQSERIKVEDALKMPPPLPPAPRYEEVPVSGRGGRLSRVSDIDVFEMGRQGRAVPVGVRAQRPMGDPPSQELLREFRNLKLRDNSEVGRHVRTEHPGTPLTSDQLEVQQSTYLRNQEELFHDLVHKPIQPVRHHSPRAQPVPAPRSQRPESRDLEVVSTYSFDVDEVNKRAEERMRRLSRMNADQVSMQDQEEVLDRFMRQRTHVTNEAERRQEQPPSVRLRRTPERTNRISYQPSPRGDSDMTPLAGINVNPRDGWEDDETPAPGGPTPLDDSWLNPTRRR